MNKSVHAIRFAPDVPPTVINDSRWAHLLNTLDHDTQALQRDWWGPTSHHIDEYPFDHDADFFEDDRA